MTVKHSGQIISAKKIQYYIGTTFGQLFIYPLWIYHARTAERVSGGALPKIPEAAFFDRLLSLFLVANPVNVCLR